MISKCFHTKLQFSHNLDEPRTLKTLHRSFIREAGGKGRGELGSVVNLPCCSVSRGGRSNIRIQKEENIPRPPGIRGSEVYFYVKTRSVLGSGEQVT